MPPLRLTYPAGVDPTDPNVFLQFEGLGYIPTTSAVFPDHLLAITIRLPDFVGVIEIIRFDRLGGQVVGGTVVKEIAFDPMRDVDGNPTNPLYTYITGLQYLGNPDRLIIAPTDDTVWVVNFDGTFSGPVAIIPEAVDIESLAVLPDGRIALTDYALARLVFLAHDFTRLPEQRNFGIGLGVSGPASLAWNADTKEFLSVALFGEPAQGTLVAFTLDSARQLVNLSADPRINFTTHWVAFVPAAGGNPARIAQCSRGGPFRGIFLYDTAGNYLSRISTSVLLPLFSRPRWCAALPGGQFAYSDQLFFPTVEVIAPDGPDLRPPVDPTSVLAAEVRRFVLDAGATPQHPAQVGRGLSFVDRGGGQLLAGNSLYDLNGNRLGQFDLSALGINSISGQTLINTGRFSGDFAVTEPDSSTLVIFRWEPFSPPDD